MSAWRCPELKKGLCQLCFFDVASAAHQGLRLAGDLTTRLEIAGWLGWPPTGVAISYVTVGLRMERQTYSR
jgi:hypothetical protein